eukprot:357392-Chlamydomonas_euryale.AAC.21
MISRWFGRFAVDVIATIPFIYLLVTLGVGQTETDGFNVIGLVRLVRLGHILNLTLPVVRVICWLSCFSFATSYDASYTRHAPPCVTGRQSAYLSASGQNLRNAAFYIYIVLLACLMMVVLNLEACLLLLVALWEGLENSWMASPFWFDIPGASAPEQWYALPGTNGGTDC